MNQYEFEGGCEYCWDRFDFCGSCTNNLVDPWRCERCLGSTDQIYDEDTDEWVACGCEYVEFVHMSDFSDRESSYC